MRNEFRSDIRPDGVSFVTHNKNSAVISLLEVKQLLSGAHLENAMNYARYVKTLGLQDRLVPLMPVLLINCTGNFLILYGAMMQRPGLESKLIYHAEQLGICEMRASPHDNEHLLKMGQFLHDIYQAHVLLSEYYERKFQRGLPYSNYPQMLMPDGIDSFVDIETGQDARIELLYRVDNDKNLRRFMYTARLEDATQVIVKFVHLNENVDDMVAVHQHCSTNGIAPKLFGYKKMYDNWCMIVNENLDFEPLNKKLFSLPAVRQAISEALNILHTPQIIQGIERKFVHGDFRYSNILVKVDENGKALIRIIDFDFAGFEGVARYPVSLDTKSLPHGGEPDGYLKQEHDRVLVNPLTGELFGCSEMSF